MTAVYRSLSTGCVEGVTPQHYSRIAKPAAQPTPAPPQPIPAAQLFEVNAETECGDTVVIVGSVAALGDWDPAVGRRMETDGNSYPLWHAWLKGCLPACEYKFVILRASGEAVWEQNENRRLRPCTNRIAAIFGDPREVARTHASDTELFARRAQVLTLPPFAGAQPSAAFHGTVQSQGAPVAPRPGAVSPYAQPPQLAIGASLQPFVPYNGASVESSPCCSRLTSHNASYSSLQRSQSHSSLARSTSAHSHRSLQRNGSRISFAENLNICY